MKIVFVGDSLTFGVPGSSYLAVMRERLPDHTLVNWGRVNDTVVSLHRRIVRSRVRERFDLAFLWVGVNDACRDIFWPFRLVNGLLGQRPARSVDQFRTCYRAILDRLCRVSGRVIAVSPALRGEDTGSWMNCEIDVLGHVIQDLASRDERVEYLDVRSIFVQALAGRRVSGYHARSAVRVLLDAFTLRSWERIDRKAAERGLYFTLDGVHLNSTGAKMVAEAFIRAITEGR